MSKQLIDELDQLRYEDPEKAKRRCLTLLEQADDPVLACQLAGVLGSSLRILGERRKAFQILLRTHRIARRLRNHATIGDLLQRLASLVAYDGQFEEALDLSRRAQMAHSLGAHVVGIGRSLVDQAGILYHLERFEECCEHNMAALRLLPEEEGRNRFSAFLNTSTAWWQLSRYPEAVEACRNAERYAPSVGRLTANLDWHYASILLRLGKYEQAEKKLLSAFEMISAPIDTALVGCDLIRTKNALGKIDEAASVASGLGRIMFAIQDHPMVVAALNEVVRLGLQGELIREASLRRVQSAAAAERSQRVPQD